MHLYKRHNIWWVAFSLNKVKYHKTTKEKVKYKALEEAYNIINKYKDYVVHKRLNLATIVNEYLNLNHFNTLSRQTQKNYKTQLKKALVFFKDKDVFNTDNIYAYLEYLIQVKGLKSSTIRSKDLTMLSKIFNEVKKVGVININPFLDLDLSSYKKTNARTRYLSLQERETIRKYCNANQKTELLNYIEFAIETGLRLGEQLNLTWKKVDFNTKELYITPTKTKINRTIPITPLAYAILDNRKHLLNPFPLSKNTLSTQYIKLKQALKLENLTWHDLRHTFASYAIKGLHSWQNGIPMPIAKLQLWLGHTEIKMTTRYSHLNTTDLKLEVKESL